MSSLKLQQMFSELNSYESSQLLSNLQMMQMLSDCVNSSGVASGYNVFMLWIARRDNITSFSAFLKFLFEQRDTSVIREKKFFHSNLNQPDCVIHRTESEQRQSINFHHQENKHNVEDDSNQTDDKFSVE